MALAVNTTYQNFFYDFILDSIRDKQAEIEENIAGLTNTGRRDN